MSIMKLIKFLDPRVLFPKLFTEIFTLLIGVVVLSAYLFIILACTPIYIFRFILSKFSKYFNSTLGKMVTARGQFLAIEDFTSTDKSPRSNIIGALTVDGYVSEDELRDLIVNNLIKMENEDGSPKHPELTQYLSLHWGFKYWKPDPDFNMSNHLKVYKNQTPDSKFSLDQLTTLIELLVNEPFQPRRSPWEFIIVNNHINPQISHENLSIVIIKFHHCLTDAYGATFTFLHALTRQIPKIPKAKFIKRSALFNFLFTTSFPFRLLREVSQFIVMSLRSHQWKVEDNRKAWHQLCVNSPVIPITKVSEIKSHLGVTFTSVVHSCLGAAMEKLFIHKYGKQKSKAQTEIPCVVMLPLPKHPHKLRNYCSGAHINVPTRSMEPVERVRQCEKDLVNVKKSTMPLLGQYLPVIGGSMFTSLVEVMGKNRSFPVNISNFPYGNSMYKINGKKVFRVTSSAGSAQGVVSLSFIVYSYGNELQISITGEKGIFSREDLIVLVDAIMEEINLLHKYTLVLDV